MLNNALQNPGQKYTINAQIKEIGQVELTKNQKRFQRVQLFDGQTQRSVKIFEGNNPQIQQTELNQWLSFDISGYKSNFDSKIYLSGFWNSNAQANQAPPQNTQQAPPQAAQATKASGDVDWDAKDLRSARQTGLNDATQLICLIAEANTDLARASGQTALVNLVTKTAEIFVDYIYNGLSKQNTVKQAADDARQEIGNHYDDGAPPPTDADVPDFLNQ